MYFLSGSVADRSRSPQGVWHMVRLSRACPFADWGAASPPGEVWCGLRSSPLTTKPNLPGVCGDDGGDVGGDGDDNASLTPPDMRPRKLPWVDNVRRMSDLAESMCLGSVAVLAQGFFICELLPPRDIAVHHGLVSVVSL